MRVFWAQRRCFWNSMEHFLNYIYWFIAGGVLTLLEFFIPGLVVIFLGLGAIATGVMLYFGYIRDAYIAIAFFVTSSIVLLVTLRRIAIRFYPSFSEKTESDEDALIAGQEAETITTIFPDNFEGRVKYSGTTWPARSTGGTIAEKQRVHIVGRENINLIVRRITDA